VVSILIKNIGKIVSGKIEKPLADGDSIVVRDGVVEEVGWGLQTKADGVIDVNAVSYTHLTLPTTPYV